MNKWEVYKLKISLVLLLILFVVGVIGFLYFQELSLLDAVYMTVITVSTVGFKEVETLRSSTRVFTIVFIVLSVILAAIVIGMLTEIVIGQLSIKQFKIRKMRQKIQSLKNHVIVCGYGRNGMQALKKLKQYNKHVVVIELDEKKCKVLQAKEVLYVNANATQDEVLEDANIKNASHLISALDDDTQNLFIVLSAKQKNKNLNIICRASTESNYKKMKLAGANNVILPEKIGGDHLASLVVTPDLLDFFDKISISDGDTRNVLELKFNVLCPELKEKSISELEQFHETGCKIIGFKDQENRFEINPSSDLVLKKDSSVIVIGNSDQMKKLRANFDQLD